MFQNIYKFRNIENLELVLGERGAWKWSAAICDYVNNLSEELVSVDELIKDDNPKVVALGNMLSVYQELVCEANLIDFATIQTECYRLLSENPVILEEIQSQLRYLMIDEYQDTNYIQEQIVFMLGRNHNNICVVGDDDQGLYRFRGATIRNILEFPFKFKDIECKIIPLVVN